MLVPAEGEGRLAQGQPKLGDRQRFFPALPHSTGGAGVGSAGLLPGGEGQARRRGGAAGQRSLH